MSSINNNKNPDLLMSSSKENKNRIRFQVNMQMKTQGIVLNALPVEGNSKKKL